MKTLVIALLSLALVGILAFGLRPLVGFLIFGSRPPDSSKVLWGAVSPSGDYEAKLIETVSNMVLNQDTESVTLKVEKRGVHGWFYTTNLEYNSILMDDGCPLPTAHWSGASDLYIRVVSHQVSGKIKRRDGDLLVIRDYVLLPRS